MIIIKNLEAIFIIFW